MKKIAKVSTSHAKDLVVAVVREELDEALAEELHVQIRSTFMQNFGKT
jgi:cobalamin-dependent methionine synthase I